MTDTKMQLVDWLDDLCVRFIINLPHEELQSVERICFQIEEAQWFYEDFIRPLDPNLPSMNLRKFSQLMFQHCPLSSSYSSELHVQAYENFLAYKTRVPVRGAIMLNQEMTHAVLVKGWKKGAKWSFPRGKINKDESDLDCAVREVYEETGYDLKDTTLVGPDEQMKKITVNMREQSMLLYVFRGVPMDTHFEPRTRKEISKIDWYKLTDLPTLKRKNQVQQGVGQDLVKDNSFYMVAPFLGPLKAWIKQQHKLDRQKARTGGHQGHLVPTGVTDNELEADFGETTADEAPILDTQPADDNFAMLVAKLGASKRGSDALPEVSVQPQALDPAAELKKLLSVGMTQTPVEAPGPQSNPLLAMLHASNSAASAPPEPIPRTPLEQLMTAPPQPHSPHGQHHPRAPQLQNMPGPPPFPFQSQRGIPFRRSPHNQMPPQHHNGMPMSIPRQFIPPPPHQVNPVFPTHAPNVQEAFSQQAPRPYQQTGDPQFAQSPQFPGVHGPAIPPASKLPAPKLTAHALGLLNAFKADDKPSAVAQLQQSLEPTHRVHPPPSLRGYESFASQQSLPSANPYVPSPPPFQSPPPSANFQPVQPKPRSAHQDSLLHLFHAASVASSTPPPQLLEEPAELSAQPNTPGYTRIKPTVHEAPPPKAELAQGASLLDAFNAQMKKKGLTSATVSGPVNAPDFDTMKKNTHHHGMNGHSRGPSPGIHEAGSHHQMFIPQQILKRSESTSKSPTDIGGPAPNAGSQSTSNMTTPQATVFKPQILKRPSQNAPPAPGSAANSHAQGLLDIFKQMSPQPAAVAPATGPAPNTHAQGLLDIFKQASPQPVPASPAQLPSNTAPQTAFDRRENFPPEQKNSLLALFGKPSQPVSPMMPSRSPVPPQGITKPPPGLPALPTKSPQPMTPNPQPPTPKNIASAVISPVSPLPDKSSQMNSPANLASRSRISSIGDVSAPSIIIPPTSHPTSHPASSISQLNGGGGIGSGTEEGYTSADSLSANLGELSAGGSIRRAPSAEGKSPVDKTFLLGFLEDVARRGR